MELKSKDLVRWSRYPDKVYLYEEITTTTGNLYKVIREPAEKDIPMPSYEVSDISSEYSPTLDELTKIE